MRPLLALSAAIDLLNEKIGNVCNWLVLLACVVSAGNAMVRYAYDYSSNAWLEVQWYMFAIIVMFGASYTLKRNEHVRVDIFYMMLSRARPALDRPDRHAVLPAPDLPAPGLAVAGRSSCSPTPSARRPSNAGGLLRWPIKLVLPVGFALLALQGVSELIKRVAALQGLSVDSIEAQLREADAMITAGVDAAADVRRPGVSMLIGYPVAFSLAARRLLLRLPVDRSRLLHMHFLQAIPGRVFGNMLSNELLLAIPFFTFMGAILEKCGLAEDMLDSMGQLFGPIRGGLGYSAIIVGFILGAITGTVAAQVIAMALITMPVMIRYKYNMRYATGVLAASGTITQLVPPSLVLIVLADQLGKSVGDMYLGAWGPSLLQIALFAGYTFLLGIVKPDHVPPVPRTRTLSGWPLWSKCLLGIIPSAVLIFLVLGTMMLGLATPTEAGAMGTIGAIVLAAMHHKEFSSTGHKMLRSPASSPPASAP